MIVQLRPLPRLVATLVLVTFALLGLLWPLLRHDSATTGRPGTLTESPATITDYDASYRVAADGHLTAIEILTVEMMPDQHGIFRFFPVADPTDPHARMVPDITAATLDGHHVPVHYDWRENRTVRVARIGDKNNLVSPGLHTYAIRYTVDGGLVPASTAPGDFTARAGANPTPPTASFYYNVVGFWAMKITAAHVAIELPGPAGLVQCTAGPHPCDITGAGTTHVTVSAEALPAGNPVTVRTDLPVPAPDRVTLPWTVRFDKILGRRMPLTTAVAVLSVVAALLGYLWGRRSRERTPGTPILYTPPDGLGPVQCAYIVTEEVGKHALEATLLHLAERKLVRLTSTNPKNWVITGTGTPDQWAAADPVTRQVGAVLGVDSEGGAFHLDGTQSAGRQLLTAKRQLESACRSWSRDRGFVVTARAETRGVGWLGYGFLGAVVGFIGVPYTMFGLPFAAFTIAGLGLLAPGTGTRRTKTGRQVWSRAAGFRRLLATPSSEDRFDYAAHRDLFIAYVPYAVAFGVADAWAAKYRTATASEPPVPDWYPAAAGGGQPAAFYSPSGLGGFDAAVTDTIGASRAFSNSSFTSSGSGGGSSYSSGGGSWGGGGGGGGGTW